jgi:hypothetical protein
LGDALSSGIFVSSIERVDCRYMGRGLRRSRHQCRNLLEGANLNSRIAVGYFPTLTLPSLSSAQSANLLFLSLLVFYFAFALWLSFLAP